MSTPSRYVEDRDKLTDEEYNDVFDKKLEETWDAVKAEGYSLVKGICRPGEDQGDENDDADGDLDGADGSKKKSKELYTKDEIDSIRCVLLTKPRLAALKKAEKMVTRNFKGWYTTHDGNEVTLDMLDCIKTAKNKRKLPDRFDAALGLTIAADSRTYWMYDNEMWGEDGELQEVFKGLGNLWSSLLEHTDEELGIDALFTRPGAEEAIRKFAASVEKIAEQQRFPYTCPWDAFKKKKPATSSPTASAAAAAAAAAAAPASTGKRVRADTELPAGAAKPAAKKPTGKKGAASTAAA